MSLLYSEYLNYDTIVICTIVIYLSIVKESYVDLFMCFYFLRISSCKWNVGSTTVPFCGFSYMLSNYSLDSRTM